MSAFAKVTRQWVSIFIILILPASAQARVGYGPSPPQYSLDGGLRFQSYKITYKKLNE